MNKLFGFLFIIHTIDGLNWHYEDSGTKWMNSCSFIGNNLKSVPTTREHCGPICEMTCSCTHFVWLNYNGGMCLLKHGEVNEHKVELTSNRAIICGIKKISTRDCREESKLLSVLKDIQDFVEWRNAGPVSWAPMCGFRTGNIIKGVQTTPDNCGPICESTCNCTHFTFSKYRDGTCWLREGAVTEKDAFSISDQDAICGIFKGSNDCIENTVYWNTIGNVKWAFSCNFDGKDMKGIKTTSDKCGPICEKTCNCTHFTYTPTKSTCWLKRGGVTEVSVSKTIYYRMICGYVWRDAGKSC